MSDYTIKNLQTDVEDSAPKFGMAPAIEARFARAALGAEKLGLALERLAPGARVPFGHRHDVQEEVYVIVEGSGRVKLDDDVHEVQQWDAVRVAGATMRCFEAGDDGLAYVAVGAPYEGRNDSEIVPGWWSD